MSGRGVEVTDLAVGAKGRWPIRGGSIVVRVYRGQEPSQKRTDHVGPRRLTTSKMSMGYTSPLLF